MSKRIPLMVAAVGLAITAFRSMPESSSLRKTVRGHWNSFLMSPDEQVQAALSQRAAALLTASATVNLQEQQQNRFEVERTQVVNRVAELKRQIGFIVEKLDTTHADFICVHGATLRRSDVEFDLARLVQELEETEVRSGGLNDLIKRLQETTSMGRQDIASARQEVLSVRTWLEEKRADMALMEVRRWSSQSGRDAIARIADSEDDDLEIARKRLEVELAKDGSSAFVSDDATRPWSVWSDGHATSSSQVLARARRLLGQRDESDLAHASGHVARPTKMPIESADALQGR